MANFHSSCTRIRRVVFCSDMEEIHRYSLRDKNLFQFKDAAFLRFHKGREIFGGVDPPEGDFTIAQNIYFGKWDLAGRCNVFARRIAIRMATVSSRGMVCFDFSGISRVFPLTIGDTFLDFSWRKNAHVAKALALASPKTHRDVFPAEKSCDSPMYRGNEMETLLKVWHVSVHFCASGCGTESFHPIPVSYISLIRCLSRTVRGPTMPMGS